MDDFRGGGHAEGIDDHFLAAQHAGEFHEVAGLAAGARSDIGPIELNVGQFLGGLALAGVRMTSHRGFELGEIDDNLAGKLLVVIHLDRLVGGSGAVEASAGVDVLGRARIEGKYTVLAAGLDGHVGDGHSVIHRQRCDARAMELHGLVGRAVEADLADGMQDDVLSHDAQLQLALESEPDGRWHLDEQLARTHHESCIGVADAGGELVEGAGHARVGIGPEENFAGAGVPLLRQRCVADAGVLGSVLTLQQPFGRIEFPGAVRVVDDVVEIRDFLLSHEVAQDVDVAVGLGIGGEDVVVGNDDHSVAVPHLGVLAELALEDADGPRSADVVGHEDIRIHPDIVTGRHVGFARGSGQQLFGQRHRIVANSSQRTEPAATASSWRDFVAATDSGRRVQRGVGS